jgi:chromate transporter
MSQPVERTATETITLGALFTGFLKVSLRSFGGGLVWARQLVVEQRGWMSEQEFVEILTLCELLPGPNIIGISVCVGAKLRGLLGAIAAVSGFVLVPSLVGFSLGALYLQHAHIDV